MSDDTQVLHRDSTEVKWNC